MSNRLDVDDQTQLVCSVVKGHEGVVKLLLERQGVDPNLPDGGQTPLGWAVLHGHDVVVKLFLGREDVHPNCPDSSDRTLLGCAAIRGHEGVVKLLLEHEGVDPDRLDKQGGTLLEYSYATRRGHRGALRLLQARKHLGSTDAKRPHMP